MSGVMADLRAISALTGGRNNQPMPLDLTGIQNVGEFYSRHYLDALLEHHGLRKYTIGLPRTEEKSPGGTEVTSGTASCISVSGVIFRSEKTT